MLHLLAIVALALVCRYLASVPLAAAQSWRAKKIAGDTTPGVAEAADVNIIRFAFMRLHSVDCRITVTGPRRPEDCKGEPALYAFMVEKVYFTFASGC